VWLAIKSTSNIFRVCSWHQARFAITRNLFGPALYARESDPHHKTLQCNIYHWWGRVYIESSSEHSIGVLPRPRTPVNARRFVLQFRFTSHGKQGWSCVFHEIPGKNARGVTRSDLPYRAPANEIDGISQFVEKEGD